MNKPPLAKPTTGGGWLAGWLENPNLMKTQSSVLTWTWTLDFDLGFVNYQRCKKNLKRLGEKCKIEMQKKVKKIERKK